MDLCSNQAPGSFAPGTGTKLSVFVGGKSSCELVEAQCNCSTRRPDLQTDVTRFHHIFTTSCPLSLDRTRCVECIPPPWLSNTCKAFHFELRSKSCESSWIASNVHESLCPKFHHVNYATCLRERKISGWCHDAWWWHDLDRTCKNWDEHGWMIWYNIATPNIYEIVLGNVTKCDEMPAQRRIARASSEG